MDNFTLSLLLSIIFVSYGAWFAQLCIFFKRNGDPWWFGILPIIGGFAALGATIVLPGLLALLAWFILFLIFGVMPGWRFCEIIGVNFFATVGLGFLGFLALYKFQSEYLLWKFCEEYAKIGFFVVFLALVFFRMNWVMWKFLCHIQAPAIFRIGLFASYYGVNLLALLFSQSSSVLPSLLSMISFAIFSIGFVFISWLMCFRPGEAPKRPAMPADKRVLGPYLGAILSGMFFPPLALAAAALACAGLRRPEPNETERKYLRAAMIIGLGVGLGFTSIYLAVSAVQKALNLRNQDNLARVQLQGAGNKIVGHFADTPNAPIPAEFVLADETLVLAPDLAGRSLNQLPMNQALCGTELGGHLHYVTLNGDYCKTATDGDVAEQLRKINKALKP
ncbi:MAG: hypothetical protein RL095_2535 [Verrucomicrobiota bacterium]|jgi:hypothetical protein